MSAVTDSMTETEWQQQFTDLLRALGWKWMHVRRSLGRGRKWTTATNVDGWPDLTCWNERQQRIVFVELKTATGRLRPAQETVMRSMLKTGQEFYVLRPDDLERARDLLSAPVRNTEDGPT